VELVATLQEEELSKLTFRNLKELEAISEYK